MCVSGLPRCPRGGGVFAELTVEENIRVGAHTRRDGKAKVAEDMEMVLGYFPILRERLKIQAGFLSGGEQQMLAIGRALMGRPSLMMLDEPSLGLAPMLVTEIFNINRTNQQGIGRIDSIGGAERPDGPECFRLRIHY